MNWRSLLFVPATAERFIAKAHTRGADAIILDLEDSIPPLEKGSARAALSGAVPRVSQAGAGVVVRINQPLALAVPDIAAAVGPGVAALMLTKVLGPDHVHLLSNAVAEREDACGMPLGSTRFLALVETVSALPQMGAIAAADPRMVAMGIGGEDLATELGAAPTVDGLYVWAAHCVAACRSAGITPMGSLGSLSNLEDLDGYRAGLRRARALGFAAASCIHPAHVPIINEEYGATEGELDRARRLVAAFDLALSQRAGAMAFEGRMIDLPIVERARRLLIRAEGWKIGTTSPFDNQQTQR
ncbi:CoA ester lyase [Roseomonas sp. KE2513]|uniref:HpcH/HpaI aldolase/citrate lyase family protein n=1 Tax=Roseomonas sp. KE2513 TaxID=2479202 RepID=UPI0018DFC4E0|nr:CoA ester lyase [Roseomonas sp. KE2513]MBI0539100.1 CoA ester lyase [Roseomonas sp. KE2513]